MTHPAHDDFKARYADKFAPADRIFSRIRRGDRIFVGTGCGEPQHLVRALTEYVRSNPKALFGAEILHVWSLGVAPYTDERLQANVEYDLGEERLWANVAFAVRDAFQNRGIGTELLAFLVHIARRQGLLGLTAEVLKENEPMLRVFEKMGSSVETSSAEESWDIRLRL
jgi:GNAT superfamily N-acetyltransferase